MRNGFSINFRSLGDWRLQNRKAKEVISSKFEREEGQWTLAAPNIGELAIRPRNSGDGKFRWTLHPPKKVADPVEIRQIYSGEVLGRREEAEAVAKKKIDELIGSEGKLREGPA